MTEIPNPVGAEPRKSRYYWNRESGEIRYALPISGFTRIGDASNESDARAVVIVHYTTAT